MLQMAQDMFKLLQDRFRTTLRVMADLAESVGVPPAVTSMLSGEDRPDHADTYEATRADPPVVEVQREPAVAPAAVTAEVWQPPIEKAAEVETDKRRPAGKRRGLTGGPVDLSETVRRLEVDDAIGGSTYLARIVWSLGVAELEGTGPLRPADIARMVMSRSAVSLEPPNVARYIRRSKPNSIVVDRIDGGSSFYKLNDRGHKLFREHFALN